MILTLDTNSVFLLGAVFAACGVMGVEMLEYLRASNIGFIAEVYQERNGMYSLLKRIKVPVGAETFSTKTRQFVVDPEKVSTYSTWNHWGGKYPVLKYDFRDAKPMGNANGKEIAAVKGKPLVVKFTREPKPSSGSTNLIFRRGGLKAMMEATKHTQMDPKLAIVVGLMVGAAAVYMITQFVHPGLVPAPPPGYYFHLEQIPANVTVAK